MKTLLITLLVSGCATAAVAQQHTNGHISQHIHDDGKIMSVVIDYDAHGNTLHYDREFNVAGMSQAQKDALVDRITDSLKVSRPAKPALPSPPPAPAGPVMASASSSHKGHTNFHSDIDDDGSTLRLSFHGEQRGTPIDYQRTFDVKGMSRAEKDQLVKHITDSLGVSEAIHRPPLRN